MTACHSLTSNYALASVRKGVASLLDGIALSVPGAAIRVCYPCIAPAQDLPAKSERPSFPPGFGAGPKCQDTKRASLVGLGCHVFSCAQDPSMLYGHSVPVGRPILSSGAKIGIFLETTKLFREKILLSRKIAVPLPPSPTRCLVVAHYNYDVVRCALRGSREGP